MKLMEEDMKQQLAKVNDQHQSELDAMKKKMDEVANDIWKEAHDQYTNALDVELSRSLTSTEAENQELRRLLDEKESIIRDNLREMKEMEGKYLSRSILVS